MIKLASVEKIYRRGAEDVHALRGVDLEIKQGEFMAIVGNSGAGKTTLLHILGCLDSPTSGVMTIDGLNVGDMDEAALVELRRRRIGLVFQQFYLIPGLSVFDNVALPLLFARKKADRKEISAILEMVGLGGRLNHLPSQLSGGEMQRVAIARALANHGDIILADEPTGNLDSGNSERIFALLQALNDKGLTIVMITHNSDLASRCRRVVRLSDGRVWG